MITQQTFWKQEIRKAAAAIEKHRFQRRWTEETISRLRQKIILGFYSINKMVSLQAPPPALAKRLLLELYPKNRTGRKPSKRAPLESFFDLNSPVKIDREIESVCAEIIGAKDLKPFFNEQKHLHGFHYTMGRSNNKTLCRIHLDAIFDLFQNAGSGDEEVSAPIMESLGNK